METLVRLKKIAMTEEAKIYGNSSGSSSASKAAADTTVTAKVPTVKGNNNDGSLESRFI